jgi:hypothetical protein
MGRRLGAAALLLAAALAVEARGRADAARSRVAIVRSSPGDRVLREASTRLRAELLGAGFDVIEVDRAPGDPRSGVEESAPDTPSFATVAMSRASNGAFADVWIGDHVTGKTVVRRVEVGPGPDATAVLAIRALELLRASLLEVAATAPRSEPLLSPPSDVADWIAPALPAAPARPALRGNALGAGVLALHGLNGIGLAVGPTVAFSHGIGPSFVGLTLADLLAGPELSTAAGSATVRQQLAALTLGWASDPQPLGLHAWVGAGGFHLQAAGSAAAPYRGVNGDVTSFLCVAAAGGLARLGPRIAVTADVVAIFLDPRPVVVIAGSDAGSAGAPSVGVTLGAVVGL